jgi:HSP20 family protein
LAEKVSFSISYNNAIFSRFLSIFQFFGLLHSACIAKDVNEKLNKKGGYMANIMKRNNSNGSSVATRSQMPLSSVVDSVFNNTLSRFFDDNFWGFNGIVSSGQVPVNIRETDKTYEMEVVAPGLRKEDFNVSISNNMLTVSFEHKEENKEENKSEGYLRQEYCMQSFSRTFTLDDTVEADKIRAQYKDGVLHLSLPKKEGAQRISKSIEIR